METATPTEAGGSPGGGDRGRRGHERANQAHWDRGSDRYQAGRGDWIAANPDTWGVWAVPEADVRVLPDAAGKDVLEFGCGGAQWSIRLARRGARMTGLDLSGRQFRARSPRRRHRQRPGPARPRERRTPPLGERGVRRRPLRPRRGARLDRHHRRVHPADGRRTSPVR